jgi:hypothetical protein
MTTHHVGVHGGQANMGLPATAMSAALSRCALVFLPFDDTEF